VAGECGGFGLFLFGFVCGGEGVRAFVCVLGCLSVCVGIGCVLSGAVAGDRCIYIWYMRCDVMRDVVKICDSIDPYQPTPPTDPHHILIHKPSICLSISLVIRRTVRRVRRRGRMGPAAAAAAAGGRRRMGMMVVMTVMEWSSERRRRHKDEEFCFCICKNRCLRLQVRRVSVDGRVG
jgi:hypothetical protein